MRSIRTAVLVVAIANVPNVALADRRCKNVTAVAAGLDSTFAVVGGALKGWGGNEDGILANGEKDTPVPKPNDVKGLASGVTEVSIKGATGCAVVGGGVECWGLDSGGEVGNGKKADSDHRVMTPVATAITSGVTKLSAGTTFNCAIVNGGVKCWGGRFGSVATTVKGLGAGATSLSIGNQMPYAWACAIVKGGAQCWDDSGSPSAPVSLPSGLAGVAVGGRFACVLTSKGGVKCWGARFGIGNGKDENSETTAVEPTGLGKGVTAIDANTSYACALVGGTVKCWGDTPFGSKSGPEAAPGLTDIATMSAGANHLCAITTKGGLKCLGANSYGQLGNGSTETSAIAVDVCIK